MLWNYKEYTSKTLWRFLTHIFVLTFSLALHTTYEQNKTRKCDTEGFVPVTILNGVVILLSSLIIYLIGSISKILYDVYINAK